MSNLANQPAFPVLQASEWSPPHEHPGITLRQYYAGLAMQGMCSDLATIQDCVSEARILNSDKAGINIMAELAVNAADALIAELEKQ